jgi:hypothetical protein
MLAHDPVYQVRKELVAPTKESSWLRSQRESYVDSLKHLIETLQRSPQSLQLVLGLCLLVALSGLIALFILVAIDPIALGGIAGLITTLTGTITFLRRKGSGSPPPPAIES